jgi:hypothetical protein
MVSSLPLPDSYKSRGAVNPEKNKYETDYLILLLGWQHRSPRQQKHRDQHHYSEDTIV